ncbi:glycosyltransferase [Vibrio fluvialis]|nr:glycosyltransferase [Vibrio fluvialis]
MNLLTIFERAEKVHLGKDVGLLIDNLCQIKDWHNTLITSNDVSNNNILSRTRIKKIKGHVFKRIDFSICVYLLANAKKFDGLNLFHLRIYNLIYSCLYAIINSEGVIYLKADRGNKDIERTGVLDSHGTLTRVERYLLKLLKNRILISYESDLATNLAKKELGDGFRVITVNNGHSIPSSSTVPRLVKENIISVVGRIGAIEKNHKLILESLMILLEKDNPHILSYKIIFAGPVENEFLELLNSFRKENSFFITNVKILGNIEDKEELYSIYARSKYFFLSSLSEGSPLVLPEALNFGCVFVSTPVSTVEEVLSEIGFVSPGFSAHDYAETINKSLNLSKEDFDTMSRDCQKYASRLNWKDIAKGLSDYYV